MKIYFVVICSLCKRTFFLLSIKAFQYPWEGYWDCLNVPHVCVRSKWFLLLPRWNIWRMVFPFHLFIRCHIDPGINMRFLFSYVFLKALFIFQCVFSENNFPRCKLFRWSAEILAVRKAKQNQPTPPSSPDFNTSEVYPLPFSTFSLLSACTPRTLGLSSFSTFCFWGNIGLTTRRTALERSNFLPWEREFLYNPVPHLISLEAFSPTIPLSVLSSCVLLSS